MRISTDKPTILRVISEAVASMTGTNPTSQDAEYENALSEGNAEYAGVLVADRAAKRGYNIRAFHGTSSKFTIFDPGHEGIHLGSRDQAVDRCPDLVLELFISLHHPFDMSMDIGDWGAQELFDMLANDDKDLFPEEFDREDPAIARTLGELTAKGASATTSDIHGFLSGLGYDGIRYPNTFEGDKYGTSFIVYDPRQVKLADPVTYDDSGSLIPLSKRFDFSNPDIRY